MSEKIWTVLGLASFMLLGIKIGFDIGKDRHHAEREMYLYREGFSDGLSEAGVIYKETLHDTCDPYKQQQP